MPSHLDTLRRIHALAITRGPLSPVDDDLSREAGMAGDYGQLLQSARDLDATETPAPAPTAHTPEPWAVGYGAAYTAGPSGEVDDESIRLLLADRNIPETRPTERDANIRRAVACVNALAGVYDPGAALAEVREILTTLLPKVEDDASRPGDRWAPLAVRRALALLGAK